ncbi:protein GPR107 [Choristoneura fumiferana]|uniref:protein GPR107 n=1 Tax=Choristoneura fumiferana TaxID=7141 RepID=UPI003D15498B
MIHLVRIFSAFVLLTILAVSARIHKLPLTDDERHYVDLTTFGFFQGGILDVRMINFKLPKAVKRGQYGFTLDRTVNDAISPYLEAHSDTCFLRDNKSGVISPQHPAIVFLEMDFENMRLNVTCNGNGLDGEKAVNLFQNRSQIKPDRDKRQLSQQFWYINKRSAEYGVKTIPGCTSKCSCTYLPITKETKGDFDYYNTSFAMYVGSVTEEGLYNLYFHNCPHTEKGVTPAMNFVIEIYESNDGNFLSAGEMPLPALYSTMSLIFLLCGVFWTFILKTSKHPVYRIHILMCVLVNLKSLSLAFHAINYYFIRTRGEHVTAWAILYYITHLLKGAVLFVTIVLVGTGWNFIKHILADRDKKLFMIVIPLQVVANVAEIIIAESEEGAAEHNAWRYTFILVDLLCCGAIMFPVVWSIRHLQDASSTDGKAAINLRKFKLFRHFYIMVVCYIYFTRFIVYLLKITVPFQYSWIDEMCRELATLVFFVMTGYKFRPAAANPYFTPTPLDDDALVLSEIGVLEGVTKIPHRGERRRDDMMPLMQDGYNSD